jgi:hypothetical protein
VTVDFPRLNYLRERVEGGDATRKEQDEWLRARETEISERDQRLRKADADFRAAFEEHVVLAVSDLRDRTQGLAGAEMIEAGRRLWSTFKRQWGEEAARKAWKAVQPQRRHGRTEWQSIPPRRRRGHRTSDCEHFRSFTLVNRADLRATQPTQQGGTLSKDEAAEEVLGEGAADPRVDPGRQIRRIKARPTIRD